MCVANGGPLALSRVGWVGYSKRSVRAPFVKEKSVSNDAFVRVLVAVFESHFRYQLESGFIAILDG
jgi:cell division protein FtsB